MLIFLHFKIDSNQTLSYIRDIFAKNEFIMCCGSKILSLIVFSIVNIACQHDDTLKKPANNSKPEATDIYITIRPDEYITTSHLELSTTLTHNTFKYPKNTSAVSRAEDLLGQGVDCIGQFTMDWGAGNTNPEKDIYNYKYLDARVRLIRKLDKKVILTLCRCPEWMRRDDSKKGVDAAPRREMYSEFAHMAADFIRHYQNENLEIYAVNVWSETRGYWDQGLGRWNLEDYADLYNEVYDSIKTVNPAVLVGGPFMHIESSPKGRNMANYNGSISQTDRQALSAFIGKARSIDFFSIDRNLKEVADKTAYDKDEVLKYTAFNGVIHSELKAMLKEKFPEVPIWVVDNQCLKGHYPPEIEAAGLASMYRWHLLGGVEIVDKWQPEDEGKESTDPDQISPEGMYTHTDTDDGAQPLPTFYIFKHYREYFPPGTRIVNSSSNNEFVETLASESVIMLINKHSIPHKVTIRIGNKETIREDLDGFEVKVIKYL